MCKMPSGQFFIMTESYLRSSKNTDMPLINILQNIDPELHYRVHPDLAQLLINWMNSIDSICFATDSLKLDGTSNVDYD